MKRYFGALICAMLVMVTFVPVGLMAGPTRAAIVNLSDVGLDGFRATGGEYAPGVHQVSFRISNSGDTYLLDECTFWVKVDHLDGTNFANFTESRMVSVPPGIFSEVLLGSVDLPEGGYNVSVNLTYGGAEIGSFSLVSVMSVIELSIEYVSFSAGAEYSLGAMIIPTCDILYDGNAASWSDDLTATLQIVKGTDNVHLSTVVVMEKSGGSPVDPPYTFLNVAFQGWIPTESGEYVATYTLPYLDSNMTNNLVSVPFTIAEAPSIEGIVSSQGTPVPDVLVELMNGETLVWSNVTDAMGHYEFYSIDAGTYLLNFSYRWAEPRGIEVIVDGQNTTIVDVELTLLEKGSFGGSVALLPDLVAAVGATVTVQTGDLFEEPFTVYDMTDEAGEFYFPMLDAGQYEITVEMVGYEPYQENHTVLARIDNVITVELDPVAFEVLEFVPPDGEMGFLIDGVMSVTFSRQIDNTTLENISLVDLLTYDTVDVDYNLSEDLMTVTLTPVELLEYNTPYMIQVHTFLKDISGEFLPQPDSCEFRTESLVLPVTITSDPANNEVDVAITSTVRVTFSAEMDADSVTSSSFKVLEDETTQVAGTITSSVDGKTYTFTPLVPFEYSTRYRVDLKNTITPVEAMYTFNGTSFIFTTLEQVTTGMVKGRVLNEDGKPFAPTLVKVTLTKGTVVKTASVNVNGNFSFTDIPAGTWTLKIVVKDYKTVTEPIVVAAGVEKNAGTKVLEKEEGGGLSTETWIIIIVAVLIIIFVIVVVYLYMKKRDEEGYEEESGYGGLRRYGGGYAGYDEMAEGEFICPNCQSVVGPEEEVCGSCGAEFERDIFECPECGATIPADAPKCPECNADFSLPEEGEGEEEYLDSDEEKVDDISHDYEVSPIEEEPEYIGMKED